MRTRWGTILFAQAVLLTALLPGAGQASNVQLANVRLRGQDVSAGVNNPANFRMIQLDISWENSWRTTTLESNWDAAWVFVKFRHLDYDTWHHASLDHVGHVTQPGAEITPSGDNRGVFIHRSATNVGVGPVSWADLELRWRYRLDGLNDYDSVEICVYAIEMVYVPQGAFHLGDGITTAVRGQFTEAATTNAFHVTSEAAITLGGGGAGSLGNNNATGMSTPVDDFNSTTTQTLPAAFPKGFNAFYIMKYEISQEQYMEFLNRLTRTQQASRVSAITVGMFMRDNNIATVPQLRNGIRVMSDPGGASPRVYGNDLNNNGIAGDVEDGQNIACNWLSAADVLAYLDWAGLRPMTELEYEKAGRGHYLFPVPGEFAWGTTNLTAALGMTGIGRNIERPSNAGANANILNFLPGPIRCGAFAETLETRQSAGATYYGVMEMTGNLWEVVVGVGAPAPRGFTGAHGDGTLDASAMANVPNWPTTLGQRGGAYASTLANDGRISDRVAAGVNPAGRAPTVGGRGVRTAP